MLFTILLFPWKNFLWVFMEIMEFDYTWNRNIHLSTTILKSYYIYFKYSLILIKHSLDILHTKLSSTNKTSGSESQEQTESNSNLTLLASIVLTLWATLYQHVSHLHWHLPFHKYLAVTYINTRNDYKKSKCGILCFLEELNIKKILKNIID